MRHSTLAIFIFTFQFYGDVTKNVLQSAYSSLIEQIIFTLPSSCMSVFFLLLCTQTVKKIREAPIYHVSTYMMMMSL